jgi:hypothetical protein
MGQYVEVLAMIYYTYVRNHYDDGFRSKVFYSLSPQMYDELVKKEADPDYELDLLGLQQQGY